MGYIHTVNITGDQSYLIEPTLFAVTSGSASVISATISNFELISGVVITLQIRTSNTAAAELSINNGEQKAIYYQGAAIEANILKQGHIYNLVYDGHIWHVLGEKLASNEMVLPHKLTFGAGQIYQYDGSADVTVPVYTGGVY